MTPECASVQARPLLIAIDGPVGAGKSSVSDEVARRLGILHLDTGAMYRAAGLYVLRRGLNPHDEAAATAAVEETDIGVRYEDGAQRTLLNGEDVTGLIRTPEVGDAASAVSKHPGVRARLVKAQRALAESMPMLMDGRDIGTVVLKDAPVKVYLTASAEARAERRLKQYREQGEEHTFEEVLQSVNARDYQDMHREADPLRQAEDAVVVDSSDLSFEETVEAILGLVKAAMAKEALHV